MEPREQDPRELLLDFHLDRLSEHDRSWIEAELRSDAKLRAESERLGQVLRPLDHWTVQPAPSNLINKVLAGVERASRLEHVSVGPAVEGDGSGRSFSLPLREILAVAACIALLCSLLVPGIADVRGRARRARCASNLGSICQGTHLYQQAFGGSLPFAGCVAGASWLPGGGDGRQYASNGRHIYLLARGNWGPKPEHFVCPADEMAEPVRADDVAHYDDFPSQRNNSYDSLNLAGEHPNIRPAMPIAYISDANPLFNNGRFDETIDPSRANSRSHGGRGQTVLTLDGSARWLTTPIYGHKQDNLWLIADIRRYTGTESPTSEDDAQLVPGYPTTDPMVQSILAH